MGKPSEAEKIQLIDLLKKIEKELKLNPKEINNSPSNYILGTLTVADIENKKIKIRENGKQKLRSIFVPGDMLKRIVRLYLGELVTLQLAKDKTGNYFLKNISKAA